MQRGGRLSGTDANHVARREEIGCRGTTNLIASVASGQRQPTPPLLLGAPRYDT
jgi:hypothetical protein